MLPALPTLLASINGGILDAALEMAHATPRPLSMRDFAPQLNGHPSSLHLKQLLWYACYHIWSL